MTSPSRVCPRGHASTDADFCSECGMKMDPAASSGAPTASAVAPAAIEVCPQCGVQRPAGARFCETCRYDFREGAPAPPAVSAPVTPSAPVAPPATTATGLWEMVVTVDPSLDAEPDPDLPCPVGDPERTFPLDLNESLVGRRSQSRGSFPAIALNDPGISHRHLMIYRDATDNLSVADLGSTNGTYVNGAATPLEAGVRTPVGPTDRVEIGRWTRITFRRRE